MGADRIYSAHLSRGEAKRPTLSSPIWAHLSSGEGLAGGRVRMTRSSLGGYRVKLGKYEVGRSSLAMCQAQPSPNKGSQRRMGAEHSMKDRLKHRG